MLAVAFRILGSEPDAKDVVQETWIKYDRADTSGVRNLPAWLTTIVSRLCIDVLRRRRAVFEEDLELAASAVDGADDPQQTALLASELATAFTIVLEELTPPQRVALVLHDAFGVPFEDVAHILDITTVSAKKLASRARLRVRRRAGSFAEVNAAAWQTAEAFLHAVREGNTRDLIAILDPDVVRFADPQVLPHGAEQRLDGVRAVVEETVRFRAVASRAHVVQIDGGPGLAIFADSGLQLAIVLRIQLDRIVHFDVVADPGRLALLNVSQPPQR